MSLHCLLASRVSEKNVAVNLVEDPLYLMCSFSLAVYKILLLSLHFDILMKMYLSVDLLVFILLGICSPS